MHITFDPIKEAINIRKHGLLLQEAENLEWDIAFAWEDDRYAYGEMRMVALVPKGVTIYYVVYVDEGNDVLRIISLREATKTELKLYVSNY